ncbi:glutathione S-transferase family protein [Glacieibacterium frigidum]|uniref:Glutathione S-transferase family protein n=1 Tax=Glacieibacterium frigidum TaxID=2593303 RepID=A0A552UGV4_9SPHN|nr:glutathione S-transferase family protein [Glacieibacterium frigidum]TRW17449.1 glutathione S-transferase family protein [Glacieibacterium frigidum]
MAELVFYTNPMSRGRIVRWMLEEVGAPYRTEIMGYEGAMQSPEFLAINPMGKVPTITHGGAVVTEAAAICAYLADAFPDAGLAPAPADRAAYYRWLFFAAGPVEAAIVNKSLGVEVPAEQEKMVGYRNLETAVSTLETALGEGPWLLGEQFTAADVYVGAQITWGLAFGSLPKTPAFEAYAARLHARPAAARAREIDDALLPEEMRGKM